MNTVDNQKVLIDVFACTCVCCYFGTIVVTEDAVAPVVTAVRNIVVLSVSCYRCNDFEFR